MKLKEVVKSKRTWGLIVLTALQIFQVNIPDQFSGLLHAFIQN